MKKKILIIGGAGFIGMNLARFLLQNRESELTLADYNFMRDSSEYFTEQEADSINFVQDDFTCSSAFEILDKDFDFTPYYPKNYYGQDGKKFNFLIELIVLFFQYIHRPMK